MARGDVLLIGFPESDKREQSGRRPTIAVQADLADQPMLISFRSLQTQKHFDSDLQLKLSLATRMDSISLQWPWSFRCGLSIELVY